MEPTELNISRIIMPDYEQHHNDKDILKQMAINLGSIQVEPFADLEQVRTIINNSLVESSSYQKLSEEWCFVDSCTADRFFRIDRAQEHLHYIMDISNEDVYILDQECATMPQTPDQERSFAIYQQKQEQRNTQSNNNFSSNFNNQALTAKHGRQRTRLHQFEIEQAKKQSQTKRLFFQYMFEKKLAKL